MTQIKTIAPGDDPFAISGVAYLQLRVTSPRGDLARTAASC
jgi:hypothetical protein